MARYVFIVKALSPRDGWVRLDGYFLTKDLGWEFYCWFYHLLVLSGDYVAVAVERTIVF